MTALLASVSSLDEAELVADCAGVIDLKEPGAGALGALAPARIAEVVQWSAGRHVNSAAAGDLPMQPQVIAAAVDSIAGLRVDFVKIGLFDAKRSPACMRAAAARECGAGLVAVMFADRAPDFDLLDDIARAGFVGAMLDTASKRSGGLRDHLAEHRLGEFVSRAHGLGLFAGLAGSLREADVPRLLPFDPDFLGFRGALCQGHDRTARISRARTSSLAGKIRGAVGGGRSGMLERLQRRRAGEETVARESAGVSP
jgi:dihydroneopterin aldolase